MIIDPKDFACLLWLILDSNEGYEIEREALEEYPGDDLAGIEVAEDTETKNLILRAFKRS